MREHRPINFRRPTVAFLQASAEALTPWLDGSASPVHEGVYRRRSPAGPYACWSAEGWHLDSPTPAQAAGQKALSRHATAAWRGLSTPSALPCKACRGHGVIDWGVDAESGRDLIEECPEC
jgi:hypothetical protein